MPRVDPLPFKEAINIFKNKVPIDHDSFIALSQEAKLRAFAMSGVVEAEILKDVQEEFIKSLENGTTIETFRDTFRERMKTLGWAGTARHRLNTTVRTNVQSVYNAGHFEQAMDAVDTFPFWQYIAIRDKNSRPTHSANHLKVYPYNHPFWIDNYPINGHNCRCTVREMTRRQIEREKVKLPDTYTKSADPGFEGNPGEAIRIDPEKYPAWLGPYLQKLKLMIQKATITKRAPIIRKSKSKKGT